MANYWQATDDYKYSVKNLQFIFTEAEKLLEDTLADQASLLNRCQVQLPILSGLLAVSAGFAAAFIEGSSRITPLGITSILCVAYMSYLVVLLCMILGGKKYQNRGSMPYKWFKEKRKAIPVRRKAREFLIEEIEMLQIKIETNKSVNEQKWKHMGLYNKSLMVLPFFTIIAYSISLFVLR